MSAFHDNALMGASGQQGYKISRSVRLRSSASAYLNRTPASATNRQIMTFSMWVKLGATTGGTGYLFSANTAAGFNDAFGMSFSSGTLDLVGTSGGATVFDLNTTQVFRDPSAWYHVVYAIDTTQATSSNRIKLYINGVQVTAFGTATYPPQNTSIQMNNNVATYIGRLGYTSSALFDGYLTEVNFIDGQALTPSSFGETDSITGVWKPKKYAGTYGTNGFYLNFSDNSGATATTIGKDYSGNGNNWTPNNISVTAGVTYDSMLDVPTLYADGGNGRGNYAVLNPLDKTSASPTYSNGNLGISAGASWAYSRATMLLPPNVKIYAETILGSNTTGTSAIQSGFARDGFAMGTNGYYVNHDSVGQIYTAGSLTASGLGALVAGDVIQFAYDGAGNAWIGKNNVWWNSSGGTTGNPSTGANPTFTGLSAYNLFISTGNYSNSQNINFGQRPFAYTPPTGFKALNTQNLPEPTIKKGNQYFDATTYTGTSASNAVVNASGFQPDLVWLKNRNYGSGTNHVLVDAVRGASLGLASNLTNADFSTSGNFSSINSNGFTVTGTARDYNFLNDTFVGWQWNAGGSTVTNTSGSISAQVRANPTAGFSVVTYTGTGANATVGHGLGVAPKMVIVKNRGQVDGWAVYHANQNASPASGYTALNETAAFATTAVSWNNTVPTSTVFSVGTSSRTNASAVNMVAYCFAEVAGFSKFGSYTGNGSADGPFIYCGFRPRFVMMKRTDSTGNWFIDDSSRVGYNVIQSDLLAEASNAEGNYNGGVDFLSNGFKLKATANGNASGGTFIFMAFAENPFRNSLAR